MDFRYGYTGQERDEETGLDYYRTRYYDPTDGRFISEDTIGFRGRDANLSRYVINSPVNYNDPYGKDLYDVVNGVDQTVGGFASGVTDGATDIIREKIYGGSVNDNQHGALHDGASFAGDLASNFVPAGKGGKLVKAGRGLLDKAQKASDLYRKGQSADRILKGCGTLDDLEELAGGLGDKRKKLGGGGNPHGNGSSVPVSNLHGNSNNSPNPNHVYVIKDTQTGDMHKVGISGQNLNKDGTSPRANPQVSKLNQTQPGRYKAIVVEKDISRNQAKGLEQTITDKYAARNGGNMPSGMQRPTPTVDSHGSFQQQYGFPHNTPLGGRY